MESNYQIRHGPTFYTSVNDALKNVFSYLTISDLVVESVDLLEAGNRVLANDITSLNDVPGFDKASMDGYAVISGDTSSASNKNPVFLNVPEKIHAGEDRDCSIIAGNAIEVSTGSAMPIHADAVVMKENVELIGNRIRITGEVVRDTNIAKTGDEIKKNQTVLIKGTWLKSPDIGMLASIGIKKIPVFKKPRVAVIATGNELIEPGYELEKNKIFESNRYVISSLVRDFGGEVIDMGICMDKKLDIESRVKKAMACDMIVVTGGSSRGERDFVPEIIDQMGKPGICVHGILMRPGSPAAIGIVNDVPIIVCPGFPVSSFFTFYTFGQKILHGMLQTRGNPESQLTAKMSMDVKASEKMRIFVRVRVFKKDDIFYADPLSTGDSRLLSTLTNSDGFIIVENKHILKKDESVQVMLLRSVS